MIDDMLGGMEGDLLDDVVALFVHHGVHYSADLVGALLLIVTNLFAGALGNVGALFNVSALLFSGALLGGVAHILGCCLALLFWNVARNIIALGDRAGGTPLCLDGFTDGLTFWDGVSGTLLLRNRCCGGGTFRHCARVALFFQISSE
jgi:hypothetical protein